MFQINQKPRGFYETNNFFGAAIARRASKGLNKINDAANASKEGKPIKISPDALKEASEILKKLPETQSVPCNTPNYRYCEALTPKPKR